MDAATRRWLIGHGLTAAIPREHCHGFSAGCKCSLCMRRAALIREHRLAGRDPFTASGAVRSKPAPPLKSQPWETRRAA